MENDFLPPEVRAACSRSSAIPEALVMARTRHRPEDAALSIVLQQLEPELSARAAAIQEARKSTSFMAQPPLRTERRIENVYLCFFASEGVTSNSWFTTAAYWSVNWLQETYAHVEVLFKFSGNGPLSYQVLTVSERQPSGLFRRDIDHYRLGRWKLLRLNNLTDAKRERMYAFARHEAAHPRSYRYASAVSTTPYLNLCTPLITYTPGCSSCISSGANTVFCVQLVMEMLKCVYASELNDIDVCALRADKLYHLVCDRLPVADSILSFEAGDINRIVRDTLNS